MRCALQRPHKPGWGGGDDRRDGERGHRKGRWGLLRGSRREHGVLLQIPSSHVVVEGGRAPWRTRRWQRHVRGEFSILLPRVRSYGQVRPEPLALSGRQVAHPQVRRHAHPHPHLVVLHLADKVRALRTQP